MVDPEDKTVVDEFMLSEYQTIASAHFDLHNGLRQNFRFYLGLIALPSSVWAVAFKDQTNLLHLPAVLVQMIGLVALLGFLMFLQMVNTRFDIILYTRVVNGVRAYFDARAGSAGSADLRKFLVLPTDKQKPLFRENPTRAYWWQFFMIGIVNSLLAGLWTANFLEIATPIWIGVAALGVHAVCYYLFCNIRERQMQRRKD
jgi:hypothetical protein